MKNLLSIFSLCMLFMACNAPMNSDFETETAVLQEDEILINWRFFREASDIEQISPPTAADQEKAKTYMDPLFEQLIPAIFAAIREGKIQLYQTGFPESSMPLENTVSDLDAYLKDYYDANWDNLTPFQQVFHLDVKSDKQSNQFAGSLVSLELIASDPAGQQPEKVFGAVAANELEKLSPNIQTKEGSYAWQDYLRQFAYYKAFPIAGVSQQGQFGLRTLREAFYMKDKLEDGAWNELQWFDEQLNVTDMKLMAELVEPADMIALSGNYRYDATDQQESNEAYGMMQLQFEKDHLVMQFATRKQICNFYPHRKNEYFDPTGYLLTFDMDAQPIELSFYQLKGKQRILLGKGTFTDEAILPPPPPPKH